MKKGYVSAKITVLDDPGNLLVTSGTEQFDSVGSWKDEWSSGGDL